jgi:hypothetical protein
MVTRHVWSSVIIPVHLWLSGKLRSDALIRWYRKNGPTCLGAIPAMYPGLEFMLQQTQLLPLSPYNEWLRRFRTSLFWRTSNQRLTRLARIGLLRTSPKSARRRENSCTSTWWTLSAIDRSNAATSGNREVYRPRGRQFRIPAVSSNRRGQYGTCFGAHF